MRRVIYDRHGDVTLYVTGAGVIYNLANQPLGFVQEERVVNAAGTVRAWFDGAFMWDLDGRVVGFVKGAKPGAPGFTLPETKLLRRRLEPTPAALHPVLVPAEKPELRWEWSEESLETLIGYSVA